MHKLLETANIKLANMVADVLGISGRAMLDALVAGKTDLERLAKLAKGQPHQTHPICFRNSSNGNRSPGHRVRLTSLWRMIRLSGML